MKSSIFVLSLAALSQSANAAIISPYRYWKSISLTLPGATFRKRDLSPIEQRSLDARNLESRADIYTGCGYYNLASKYKGFPINGFAYASTGLSFGSNDDIEFPGLYMEETVASSAYDCCVQAMQRKNSTMFFYTSNPNAFGNSCNIASNNYNPIPYNEIMLMSLSFNASAPRGTSYGNYIGNGNIGSGVRVAMNNAANGLCTGSFAGAGSNNGADQSASASAGSSSCAYTPPNVADQGGNTPAGNGAAAAAASAALVTGASGTTTSANTNNGCQGSGCAPADGS